MPTGNGKDVTHLHRFDFPPGTPPDEIYEAFHRMRKRVLAEKKARDEADDKKKEQPGES